MAAQRARCWSAGLTIISRCRFGLNGAMRFAYCALQGLDFRFTQGCPQALWPRGAPGIAVDSLVNNKRVGRNKRSALRRCAAGYGHAVRALLVCGPDYHLALSLRPEWRNALRLLRPT